MIRRCRRIARLLSVATAPVVLFGWAAQPVRLDAEAPRGVISGQPGRRGVVVAAPHGTSDVRTGDIAAEIARRTGFGLVVASGFALAPDTRTRAGRRCPGDRPLAGGAALPGEPAARGRAGTPARGGGGDPGRAARLRGVGGARARGRAGAAPLLRRDPRQRPPGRGRADRG